MIKEKANKVRFDFVCVWWNDRFQTRFEGNVISPTVFGREVVGLVVLRSIAEIKVNINFVIIKNHLADHRIYNKLRFQLGQNCKEFDNLLTSN